MGHQLIAHALGAKTYKLKFGHRGIHHPVMKYENGKATGKTLITSQNHGFAVDENSLPAGVEVTYRHANDGSNEGICAKSLKCSSVQFHPEAAPGPLMRFFLEEFVDLISRNHTVNLEPYISQILESYGKGVYYEEIRRAKEYYFSRAIKVAEGSDRYEAQLNQFFDWFVFERNLEREELPPIRVFIRESLKNIKDEKVLKVFEGLGNSVSSVFELLKIKDNEASIRDLYDREEYLIEDIENPKIFQKGDVFQARIVPVESKILFHRLFSFIQKKQNLLNKEIKNKI